MINRLAQSESDLGQKLLPDYTHGLPPEKSWTDEFQRQFNRYVAEHPVLSLSLGLTVGIVFGCLIKRR